ncbi:molybdopterin biosynthesis protein [Candidatus Magnetoovum chiemensis]|nr:molybdopterin biosynthesis protein [Candidatus Magnetoovum chiemensis]
MTKNTCANKMSVTPVHEAVGMVLAHDITEVRKDEFKGRAFKKGHIVQQNDIEHLLRLGKENLFVINLDNDEMHEDEAAYVLAKSLIGKGVEILKEPSEGKIDITASIDGLLKIDKAALKQFNMHGDVMCATLHSNTVVKKGTIVAGTRAIPLVVKKDIIAKAVEAVSKKPVITVYPIKNVKAGLVITGNEVYYGRIKDAFEPIIREKLNAYNVELISVKIAPDDSSKIEEALKEILSLNVGLIITTGGMSVDPDDVTRFAIRNLGVTNYTYGTAILPGAMFLIAYYNKEIPILGIPACGMYKRITAFDLILPRALTGEIIGREDIAELGHGGLCLNCPQCGYPVCPFGKN